MAKSPKYGVLYLLTAYLYHANIICVIFIKKIHVIQYLEEKNS